MNFAEKIRTIAKMKYVVPARSTGNMEFSIAVKDLMKDAEAEGISAVQRVPLFCTSIQTRSFCEDNSLEIERIDGPASKKSTTVVVHYRLRADHSISRSISTDKKGMGVAEADPLMELSGMLRGAIREGAAAFLQALRRDKEKPSEGGRKKDAA